VIRRHRGLRKTLFELLKALVLVYAFLAAIKMMGHGLKITSTNPEYITEFSDAAFGKTPEEVADLVVTPAYFTTRGVVLEGRKVGAIGRIALRGDSASAAGLVAVEDRVLKAVLMEGLPACRAQLKPNGPAWIRRVVDDHVVVEPVGEQKDWLYRLFGYARNPFLALLVGILITAIFQSSSFTTSFTVGMVAAVHFPLECAIPIVMGANIGTSVTCVIVSLGYVRRGDEFRRAFAAALADGFFKILTVAVMFTIEMSTGAIRWLAVRMAGMVYQGGTAVKEKPPNLISIAVGPVIDVFHGLLSNVLGFSDTVAGVVMVVVAVVLLFVALLLLVRVLRSVVLQRAEGFFDRVLFRRPFVAFLLGLVLTASVQSSSVTTSLMVPLVAAGLLTLEQIFPYLLGANIGTTVTALLAAFATAAATQEEARLGLTVACAHTLVNALGASIFYPLRWIPIAMARALAAKATESKRYAVIFILGVFFGIPLVGIGAHWFYSTVLAR